jgi:putative Holliday junction resolvase
VAVCDATRTFVFGRDTLVRMSEGGAFDAIAATCKDDAVGLIVMGLPMNADGTEGPMAQAARAWGARLEARVGVPVTYFDERYTTLEADEALRVRHRDWRERKKRVDRAAAVLILESYLSARRGGGPSSPP